MSEIRQIEDTGRPARENNGTHLQGGRSHSALTGRGNAHPEAASTNGAVPRRRSTPISLSQRAADWWSSHWRRGRWSMEATEFMDSLAAARAREAPGILWRSASLGWRRRWSRMFAVSCARAFADSLVALSAAALSGIDGPSPDWPTSSRCEAAVLVEYTFIQKRFHPVTLSSKTSFIP